MDDVNGAKSGTENAALGSWQSPRAGNFRPVDPTARVPIYIWLLTGIIVAGLFAVIAWSASVHQQRENRVVGINPELEERGKSYIANLLRDPSSAQFRKTHVYGECLTGEVNGRNGFGGYAGFGEFFYNDATKSGRLAPSTGLAPKGSLAALDETLDGASFYGATADCIGTGQPNRP